MKVKIINYEISFQFLILFFILGIIIGCNFGNYNNRKYIKIKEYFYELDNIKLLLDIKEYIINNYFDNFIRLIYENNIQNTFYTGCIIYTNNRITVYYKDLGLNITKTPEIFFNVIGFQIKNNEDNTSYLYSNIEYRIQDDRFEIYDITPRANNTEILNNDGITICYLISNKIEFVERNN